MKAVLLCSMMAWASLLLAADDAALEGKQLFERGVQALAEQHWIEAEALLRRSVELAPRASSLYNLALALCELERHVECAELAERAAADNASAYREHAARLRDRALSAVGRLTLQVEPEQSVVRIDGDALAGERTRSTLLAPGRHVVQAEAAGRMQQEFALEIAAGEQLNQRLVLQLRAAPERLRTSPAPLSPALLLRPDTPAARESDPNLAAWIVVGSSVLLLSAAVVTGLMADSADDDFVERCGGTRNCNPSLKPTQTRAEHLALATDVLLGLGLVSAGTGVALWLLPNSSSRSELGFRISGRY